MVHGYEKNRVITTLTYCCGGVTALNRARAACTVVGRVNGVGSSKEGQGSDGKSKDGREHLDVAVEG